MNFSEGVSRHLLFFMTLNLKLNFLEFINLQSTVDFEFFAEGS